MQQGPLSFRVEFVPALPYAIAAASPLSYRMEFVLDAAIAFNLLLIIKWECPAGEMRFDYLTSALDVVNQAGRVLHALRVLLEFRLVQQFHRIVEMDAVIEIQIGPLQNAVLESSRRGDIRVDQVD